MQTMTQISPENPLFTPRRFAHVNLWVSNYERSADFYRLVAGFNEVYRQPGNNASFMSNGNTYHDFGLTDTSSKYAEPGQQPGRLFHLALEVENEAELVRSYQRGIESNITFRSTVDHDVARSIYLYDPDGTIIEIYADIDENWREHRKGIVTKAKPKWIPGVTAQPLEDPLYPKDPEIDRIEEAVFHGKRVTHVAMVTEKLEEMLAFYQSIVGLKLLAGGVKEGYVVLRGRVTNGDVTLLRRQEGMECGMHHVGIEVWDNAELTHSISQLGSHNIHAEREINHPARHAVTLRDPDGIRLQFYVNRDWCAETLKGLTAEDAVYLL